MVEEQQVGADVESECDAAQGVEAGLGLVGFIAAQEGDVDADAVGEGLLGEVVLLAQFGEPLGEGPWRLGTLWGSAGDDDGRLLFPAALEGVS